MSNNMDLGYEMFCYQCEQTANGKGCTKMGVCGKTPEIANLQDLLIYQAKGICCYAKKLLETGEHAPKEVVRFLENVLFTTLTNVNFDADVHVELLKVSQNIKEDQDSHIVAVRENVYHSVLKNMGDRSLKAETGIQDSTHKNTDEQGTVHLFCDKCQPDRHDRRNERPERRIDRRHILFRLLRAKYGCREHQDQHHGKHCCPFYIFLHIRHNGFLPPVSGKFHALRFSCKFYVLCDCPVPPGFRLIFI